MLTQSLQQKMLQKLSPQQIQLMKLLQIPTIQLEQRIKEELEENPALEEGDEMDEIDELLTGADDEEAEVDYENEENANTEEDDFKSPDEPKDLVEDQDGSREDFDYDTYFEDDEIPAYKLEANNSSPDDVRKEIPITFSTSFKENLISQLGFKNLDDRLYQIGYTIIGNLDDDGYLRREIASITDDLAFSQNVICTDEEVEKMLLIIQTFEPAGVGARDLRECLLLQLKNRDHQTFDTRIAAEILDNYFEEFTKKHFEKIALKLEIEEEDLRAAVLEIVKLNPKPGGSSGVGGSMEITPDFILINNDGDLEVTLNARNAPELRVSKTYNEMLKTYTRNKSKSAKEAVQFVKQKIDSAKWFIDAIKQRHETLLLTMRAIVERQYDYFVEGDETRLKPMILKDIADKTGLDISTISRVVNSKYVQTEFGTISLKYFFAESLSTDSGEEVSTREVKKILQEVIGAENKKKPLTDDKLCVILKAQGYNIARRTVAKYREQLNLPVARLRKEL